MRRLAQMKVQMSFHDDSDVAPSESLGPFNDLTLQTCVGFCLALLGTRLALKCGSCGMRRAMGATWNLFRGV
eukprot:1969993-Amphidinium_carterae.1